MLKNVAGQKWIVFAFSRTSNNPVTGDANNITANLRLDGGSANPVDDTNPTELSNGYYVFDISQAESNADSIVIIPVSATPNVIVIGCPGAVWTESKTGYALTVSPPTASEIDTELSANHGSGMWDRAVGSGSTLKTYTQLYNDLPLADCEIWVSTDLLQANIVASGITDALGKVYLYPDVPVGTTLYVWRRKTGYSFTNPDSEVM